jgi:hypothetical protein
MLNFQCCLKQRISAMRKFEQLVSMLLYHIEFEDLEAQTSHS